MDTLIAWAALSSFLPPARVLLLVRSARAHKKLEVFLGALLCVSVGARTFAVFIIVGGLVLQVAKGSARAVGDQLVETDGLLRGVRWEQGQRFVLARRKLGVFLHLLLVTARSHDRTPPLRQPLEAAVVAEARPAIGVLPVGIDVRFKRFSASVSELNLAAVPRVELSPRRVLVALKAPVHLLELHVVQEAFWQAPADILVRRDELVRVKRNHARALGSDLLDLPAQVPLNPALRGRGL